MIFIVVQALVKEQGNGLSKIVEINVSSSDLLL